MTLEEYDQLFNKLLYTKITTSNLEEFQKFIRFSPEKFSEKLGIDKQGFIKKCNSDKREIHNKILGWNKIKKLKKYKPINKVATRSYWNRLDKKWDHIALSFRVCICQKYIVLNMSLGSKYRFYEDIKYIYCYDPMYDNRIILVNHDESFEFKLTIKEFNEHFIDWRDHLISDILS